MENFDGMTILFLGIILLGIVGTVYILYWSKQWALKSGKFSKKDLRIITSLILAYFLVLVFRNIVSQVDFSGILYFVFNIAEFTIKVGIALIIIPKLFSIGDILITKNELDITSAVSKVLDSELFLTTLRNSITTGNSDDELGLNQIPIILHTLDEKRRRFEKSSRIFLITTTIIGLLFVGVTIWLGYIIYDEQSVGTSKTIAKMEESLDKMSQDIAYLKPIFKKDDELLFEIKKKVREIQSYDSKNNLTVKEILYTEVDSLKSFGQINSVLMKLRPIQDSIRIIDPLDKTFKNTYEEILALLSNINSRKEIVINELPNFLEESEEIRKDLRKEIEVPSNRIAEVIKRIVLSFVIVSFFLAILRFMSNLYKSHHSQMLSAENDFLAIQKFVIALKNSTEADDKQQKKIVIEKFLSSSIIQESKESAFNSKNDNIELLKQLIGKLTDKL